ncbi:MAG: FtsW/RodA/SpoVE family cell cycle protein [Acidobacteria bacterium]|nr:FtsW/RodA/SpoVE family cell cycle protein [Acidobacteriota bacterium]
MHKILQLAVYFAWALWLIYSYTFLFSRHTKPGRNLLWLTLIALPLFLVLLIPLIMFRKIRKKEMTEPASTNSTNQSPMPSFIAMGLITITLISLFLMLGKDFKSDTNYFIERYDYKIKPQQKEIIIGNAKDLSDITIENDSSAPTHVRLTLNTADFSIRNISQTKKVDVNGRYLNKLVIKENDEIELMGRDKIRVLKINNQYPLGRSLEVSIHGPGLTGNDPVFLHTLLNKPFLIKYHANENAGMAMGLNSLSLPGQPGKTMAYINCEPNRFFLGMNIYYIIVFFAICLLTISIFLYLKNRFNGALLLLMMASLPFMAGAVSWLIQLIIVAVFIPFILYVQNKRKLDWNWKAITPAILFVVIFILPLALRMDGDFTIQYYDSSQGDSLKITRGTESFLLEDIEKSLAYNQKHTIILGHTPYELLISGTNLSLTPLGPEKIKFTPGFKAIISDLTEVKPNENYIYLDFPHRFNTIPAAAAVGKERLNVSGFEEETGNSLVLSRIINENYSYFTNGFIFYILIPFWLFWFINYFDCTIGGKGLSRLKLFDNYNVMIYQFVFFMLGLGYIIFGGLALYNNYYLDGFQKYRGSGLPFFVGLFLLSLVLSRYNRPLIFLYRIFTQKKYYVPLIAGIIILLPLNYSKIFLFAGLLFLAWVFLIRLRKDIYYEYRNTQGYPLNIKHVLEKTIAGFENEEHKNIFFGLGKVLNNNGWNYLITADLFLLLALFFIVLQVFMGSELGVSAGGFFFLPIELGKILLTLYFADWVSRIDKGMALNVLWIYGLVLIPFFLLIVFLMDFSPLLVFSFVFLYHIIKINKTWPFKLFLFILILTTLVISVKALSDYTFPFTYFGIIFTILTVLILLRIWFNKSAGKLTKILGGSFLVVFLVAVNYLFFFNPPAAPKTLSGRIGSWLDPWRDYNLSYQYVNSLWFMKGTGTFGKSTAAFTTAGHVPLIEKDLGFSLYIGVLGAVGAAFIFLTLFIIIAYVHKITQTYSTDNQNKASPVPWYLYQLEFLAVIFLAQFFVPALYVVGLLPVMGQPLPFLSYSNNILLLFALPFSFLMIVLGNNIKEDK